jgi:hypothetical protein
MDDVVIGAGSLAGKGVYAARVFKKGEVVVTYNLQPLTHEQYEALSESERQFTHTQHGVTYLYPEPARYVNHSPNPNTYQDHDRGCDIALKDIKEGEAITTDATKDDVS